MSTWILCCSIPPFCTKRVFVHCHLSSILIRFDQVRHAAEPCSTGRDAGAVHSRFMWRKCRGEVDVEMERKASIGQEHSSRSHRSCNWWREEVDLEGDTMDAVSDRMDLLFLFCSSTWWRVGPEGDCMAAVSDRLDLLFLLRSSTWWIC
jgi:hypothetical protein